MEFQLYTVCLEDRPPRGLPDDVTKEDLLHDDFFAGLQPVPVSKLERNGAAAFLFGRTAEGASVCVRVDGFCPTLYYALADGESADSLRPELEREIRGALDVGTNIQVRECTFAHFQGYEPAPTGRKCHRYAEAAYPSLRAWRAACALRKKHALARLRAAVHEQSARVATLESEENAVGEEVEWARRVLEYMRRKLAADEAAVAKDAAAKDDADDTPAVLCRHADEAFVDPVTRFLFVCDLTPSRWYRTALAPVATRVTTCDHELRGTLDGFARVVDRDLDAPYVTMYYDIETMGLDPNVYMMIQVSLVFVRAGVRDCHIVALGTVADVPGATLHSCATEAQVLDTYRRLVVEHDPDFVVAYNGVNFDNNFMATRAGIVRAQSFWYQSRFALTCCRLRELQLSSFGMGDNLLRYVDAAGRTTLDWNVKLKRDMPSEPTYKLDHFGRTLCGDHKHEIASGDVWKMVGNNEDDSADVVWLDCPALADALGAGRHTFSPAEWRRFEVSKVVAAHRVRAGDGRVYRPANVAHRAIAPLQNGSPEDRAVLAAYCVHDSVLLDKLDSARTMLTEILQFSGVFHIPPEWVYFRGQQVRYVAQLLRKARTAEAVPLLLQKPPEGWSGEGVEGYEGATVNEPMRGFYKTPVVVLDWKSLYPSIMMAHNLCPSTYVKDPKLFTAPGVVTHTISPQMVTHFTTAHRGILPLILEELMAERDKAKAQVKRHLKLAKDETLDAATRARHTSLAKVFDGRQLAVKVACNSVYGANGAVETGKCPCLAVSATTTYQGREAMVIKKAILPRQFPGVEVVYGDSVAGYTPLLVRLVPTMRIAVVSCDSLEDLFDVGAWTATADGKEVAVVAEGSLEAWTEAGWTAVHTIFRHRVAKPMYRVTTHMGAVDVTEDHSLLRADGRACAPQECRVGETALLHSWPTAPLPRQSSLLAPSTARLLGAYVAGRDAAAAPPMSLYHKTMCHDSHGRRRVPDAVLNGALDVKEAFVVGACGDGEWGTSSRVEWQECEQAGVAALGLYALLCDLGYQVAVTVDDTGCCAVDSVEAAEELLDAAVVTAVRGIHVDGGGEYVYDLTTANHHFQAGIGALIVHNTDSVFLKFADAEDVATAARRGLEATAFTNRHFQEDLNLKYMIIEFEKVYHPYLIESKKRYMGGKHEPDSNGVMVYKGIDAKGIESERRDTLPFTKQLMVDVMNSLMVDMDEHKTFRIFCERVDALVRNEVPMAQLTLRKNLSSKVAGKTDSIAWARVNALKRAREAGSESAINEQVEYVIVNGYKGSRTTELAEDPAYVREHGLQLNRKWYFEHSVEEAFRKVFEVFSNVDFKGACARFRALLDGERLGVNRSALGSLLVMGGAAASSSAAHAMEPPPRPPPRPPARPPPRPPQRRKLDNPKKK